ncbi:PP2C family protein-serine/threonine phosphatase [Mucilaginibacter ginkgonis]|uniref:Fused response regulator/phosphatase n=1 Tax=Mucilaginibacter ginkgonis TaxID=2682091 RepID=A0A6I4IPC0_9SPHI|nr:fused response regulator/phosphatase [Mucilaginibacter ginkgonis]QQL50889.1 fused response regulator/phosphatase [Mucilaginibacter ginkgonis]
MAADKVLKTILLVDDNLLFLKMMHRAFTKAGFDCVTAESAKNAIDILAKEIPQAIISDYQMPEMNGLEFRQYLLDQPELKDIPFLFLTDFNNHDLVTAGLNLQAIDYLIKSTPVEVVVAKVNNLVNAVSSQRELSELEIKKAVEALNIRSVPHKAPEVNGFEINFWHQSFKGIPGGDFIDFIDVSDDCAVAVLGDVMGKKWMAWFLSFSFLSYIRSAVRFGVSELGFSAAVILQKINNIVYSDEALKDILSSLSLLMIDHKKNTVTYSGAGDLPIMFYKAASNSFQQIKSSGLLLGLFKDGDYNEHAIEMNKGDQLFIFTDGIIDYALENSAKTDYALFESKLKEITTPDNSFKKLETYLTQKPADNLVDDCSIIHIYKT